ncbi:MAG: hypothetical protein K0R29_2952 [Pseudobdellovibrio sp.]|jgi:flagellar biosynthesis/type III secretory pathway M-ring protein FliF/YscJ|nr:hypothetical protein [Pseudobdellovibrio sp.]
MPELAAGYCIGAALSLVTTFLFFYTHLKIYKNPRYRTLQNNLQLLKVRWSEIDGRLEKFSEGAEEEEVSRAKNSFLIFGIFAVILSWAGLFFLLLMWFSIKKLVKNRLEDYLFASEAAQKQFSKQEMRDFWLKLQSAGFDSLPVTEQANS